MLDGQQERVPRAAGSQPKHEYILGLDSREKPLRPLQEHLRIRVPPYAEVIHCEAHRTAHHYL